VRDDECVGANKGLLAIHLLVLGVDDKDGANGKWEALLCRSTGIQHAKGLRDLAVGVTNNGEFNLDFVFAVRHDITEPIVVRLDGVDRKRRNEAFHSLQLIVFLREAANLGRAHRREIGRMRKENSPLSEDGKEGTCVCESEVVVAKGRTEEGMP
jgi:hypothetical protein